MNTPGPLRLFLMPSPRHAWSSAARRSLLVGAPRAVGDGPSARRVLPETMTDPAGSFEPHRRRLLGLAYRMLGSMAEAEDAVQETYLRWRRS